MTTDPLALAAEVDRATERLLHTLRDLSDKDASAPSLLPGWTRGHVLTHLARNADGCANLLRWASTGVVTPKYASVEQRDADIEAGAGRPAADLVTDVAGSGRRLAAAAAAVPAAGWSAIVDGAPAEVVLWSRLREVEVHHVDLDLGYGPTDWPAAFAHRLLHEVTHDLNGRTQVPAFVVHATDLGHDMAIGAPGGPTVVGGSAALAAWLIGRAAGAGLTVEPAGDLPSLPEWR